MNLLGGAPTHTNHATLNGGRSMGICTPDTVFPCCTGVWERDRRAEGRAFGQVATGSLPGLLNVPTIYPQVNAINTNGATTTSGYYVVHSHDQLLNQTAAYTLMVFMLFRVRSLQANGTYNVLWGQPGNVWQLRLTTDWRLESYLQSSPYDNWNTVETVTPWKWHTVAYYIKRRNGNHNSILPSGERGSRIFLDGVMCSNNNGGVWNNPYTGTTAEVSGILGRSTAPGRGPVADCAVVYTFRDRDITLDFIHKLHKDPIGPLRNSGFHDMHFRANVQALSMYMHRRHSANA